MCSALHQITTTFPKDPVFTFSSTLRFPIENRDALGETQVATRITLHLRQVSISIKQKTHTCLIS